MASEFTSMKFSEFSKYLEKLEETSSRLALIDILSSLYKEVSDQEVKNITYLIQGRVAPFFAPTEIGMAEKSVAKSLEAAYGVPVENVIKEFNRLGDLGLAARDLAKNH